MNERKQMRGALDDLEARIGDAVGQPSARRRLEAVIFGAVPERDGHRDRFDFEGPRRHHRPHVALDPGQAVLDGRGQAAESELLVQARRLTARSGKRPFIHAFGHGFHVDLERVMPSGATRGAVMKANSSGVIVAITSARIVITGSIASDTSASAIIGTWPAATPTAWGCCAAKRQRAGPPDDHPSTAKPSMPSALARATTSSA